METLKIDIQNDDEKRVLLAFLDSLNYQYHSDNNEYVLSDAQIQEMIKRKNDLLAGRTTSRPWSEIKKRYTGV